MNTQSIKENRLTARASGETTELVKHAAELLGISLSQFIIEATTAKALEEIDRHQKIKLSFATANAVFDILDKPLPPNQALIDAAARYKTKIN